MMRFVTGSLIALLAAGSASAQVGSVSVTSSSLANVGDQTDLEPTESIGSIQRYNARRAEAISVRDCAEFYRAFSVRNTRSPSRRRALLAGCLGVAWARGEKLRVAINKR